MSDITQANCLFKEEHGDWPPERDARHNCDNQIDWKGPISRGHCQFECQTTQFALVTHVIMLRQSLSVN